MTRSPSPTIHYQLTEGDTFQRHALCGRLFIDPDGERFTRIESQVTCQKCQKELAQRYKRAISH